jgi:hypothetical protein
MTARRITSEWTVSIEDSQKSAKETCRFWHWEDEINKDEYCE